MEAMVLIQSHSLTEWNKSDWTQQSMKADHYIPIVPSSLESANSELESADSNDNSSADASRHMYGPLHHMKDMKSNRSIHCSKNNDFHTSVDYYIFLYSACFGSSTIVLYGLFFRALNTTAITINVVTTTQPHIPQSHRSLLSFFVCEKWFSQIQWLLV